MKRFKFNLESVLKYREGIERQEKSVLAGLNSQLLTLLHELDRLNSDFKNASEEFERLSRMGMTILEIRSKHAMLENIEFYIERKLKEIEEQHNLIKKQTAIVVKSMRDTKTMDRLKEIKYREYKKEENKENELFIEEFSLHKIAASRE